MCDTRKMLSQKLLQKCVKKSNVKKLSINIFSYKNCAKMYTVRVSDYFYISHIILRNLFNEVLQRCKYFCRNIFFNGLKIPMKISNL